MYNGLVKSSLMYGSIIWSPNNKSTIYNLEKVQNKYLKFLSWKTENPMTYTDHNYTNIKNKAGITSLELSRFKNNLIFMYKLANGYIKCLKLY